MAAAWTSRSVLPICRLRVVPFVSEHQLVDLDHTLMRSAQSTSSARAPTAPLPPPSSIPTAPAIPRHATQILQHNARSATSPASMARCLGQTLRRSKDCFCRICRSEIADVWIYSYIDLYVSTEAGSPAFVGNRSLVIEYANNTIIACGNFSTDDGSESTSPGSSSSGPTSSSPMSLAGSSSSGSSVGAGSGTASSLPTSSAASPSIQTSASA